MKIELDNNQKIAILGTFLFSILVVVLLMILYMHPPYPPKELPGMEVALGYSITAGGDDFQEVVKSNPQPTQANDTKENLITAEHSDVKVEKQSPDNTEKTEKQTIDPVETIDPNKLFDPTRFNKTGGSKGSGTDDGKQGKPNGTEGGSGDDIGGNSHGNVSLVGRTIKSYKKPEKTYKENGTVVVKIYVNRAGIVTTAKIQETGTNTANSNLRKLAIEAAKMTTFDPKPNATAEQIGTITYKFNIQN